MELCKRRLSVHDYLYERFYRAIGESICKSAEFDGRYYEDADRFERRNEIFDQDYRACVESKSLFEFDRVFREDLYDGSEANYPFRAASDRYAKRQDLKGELERRLARERLYDHLDALRSVDR